MKNLTSFAVAAALGALTACGAATSEQAAVRSSVTITNCNQEVTFPSPARRIFVNDSNLAAMLLAIGAEDQVVAASAIGRDEQVLREHYGDAVTELKQVSPEYPGLETVLAARPDVMVAGWNYGYDETKQVTPTSLGGHDVAAYTLTESCRQRDGRARGIVNPWTALRSDLENLGAVTGRRQAAAKVVADVQDRLAALRDAPAAKEAPVVFVFDSGEKAVFTSGSFGAPQAIIEAGGGRNAMADLDDTWTEVSWERLAASRPEAFVFVDYPGQTFAQKVKVLASHPATRDLPSVRKKRFLNLPYAMWTSGPLNIDAAERVRTALESWDLVPAERP